MYMQIVSLCCVLIGLVLCQTDTDLFRQHVACNKKHHCGPPQPRVHKWQEVITGPDKPDPCEIISPFVTVLHRCDFAGGYCQEENKSCQPMTTETVTLTFRLIRKKFKGVNTQCSSSLGGAAKRFLHVSAVNHTLCSCQDNTNLPK